MTGLQILTKLGDSIGPRSLLNLRTELAIKDEMFDSFLEKVCGQESFIIRSPLVLIRNKENNIQLTTDFYPIADNIYTIFFKI